MGLPTEVALWTRGPYRLMMDNSQELGEYGSRSRVFISYARKDGADCASSLYEKLQQVEPPIDLWQDRVDMQSGRWWDQIQEAIKQCDTMIIVLTPCALASSVCRQEWQYARQHGVKVVPVLCPESPVDPSDKSILKWMQAENWLDPTTQWDNLISDLRSPVRRDRVPFMAADLPDNFVERPELFQELRDQILQDSVQPVAITTSLQGAGGFGKTTLARALCHDDDVISHFYHGVLWVTLGQELTEPDLLGRVEQIIAALTGRPAGVENKEQAGAKLAEVLEEKHCLLVVDDVWKPDHLRPFLQGGPNCTRLITTRQTDLPSQFRGQFAEGVREISPMTSSINQVIRK